MKHKLLSVKEMQAAEQSAITSGVECKILMEHAGVAVVKHIRGHFARGRAVVLCGTGHNGGDGFVVARLLKGMGWSVQVSIFGNCDDISDDGKYMLDQWNEDIVTPDNLSYDGATLVVDALFGTGLNRDLSVDCIDILKSIPDIPIVAVDMPSGIDSDSGQILGYARQCYSTVTFCCKKTGHMLYPARGVVGKLIVADISINETYLDKKNSTTLENHRELWEEAFNPNLTQTHKFTRGYVVIAGAQVMTGATRLAARAAQRVGAGYVVIASPEKASTLYRVSLSSVVVKGYRDTTGYKDIVSDPRADAFLIGPGMGYAFGAQERVLTTLSLKKPTVLDADALSLFEGSEDLLFKSIKGPCIMTPHEGEFARLFPDIFEMNIGKLEKTRKAAQVSGAVIIYKGPDTVIAAPDGRALINSNASSNLATAGTGDVLAGIVVSYLSQGHDIFSAAGAAVWMHSDLGNLCGEGLIAEDLIEKIKNP